MTRMAAMPIYGNQPLKNLLQNQKADDLGTWYDKLAKIYTNFFGHIAKMADMPIYSKNTLKSSPPEPKA